MTETLTKKPTQHQVENNTTVLAEQPLAVRVIDGNQDGPKRRYWYRGDISRVIQFENAAYRLRTRIEFTNGKTATFATDRVKIISYS